MSKILSLVKVSFQTNYDFFSNKNARAWFFLSALGSIVLALISFRLIHSFVQFLYDILSPVQQESFILGFGLTTVTFILFFLNISNILKVFFYSEDLEQLLPLPLLPFEILSAKFIVLLLSSYFINFLTLGPILLSYGIVGEKGILYYLYSVIIFLLLPVLPIIFMAIIMLIVMRYTNVSKNKDRTKVIGGILSIAFAIGINILVRQQNLHVDMEGIVQGWATEGSLLEQITTYFPTSYLGAQALDNAATISGFLYLLGFILLSVAMLGVFLTLGQRMYYQSIMGLNAASTSKKRKATISQKQGAVVFSYVKKEMRILMRTPAFFIGCVVQTFYMPIFLGIILFLDTEISLVFADIGIGMGTALLIMLLITGFILSFNPTSITSISREGANWFTNKYLPIKATTIIYGKAMAGWCFQLIILVGGGILLGVLLHFPIVLLMMWFIISCMATFLSNVVEVYINAKNPNLHWENEQQALKGMRKYFFNLLVRMILFGGILLITFFIALFTDFHTIAIFGSLLLLHLAVLYGMKLYIGKTAEEIMNDIS